MCIGFLTTLVSLRQLPIAYCSIFFLNTKFDS